MSKPVIYVRLKSIHEVHFGSSEKTNFNALPKARRDELRQAGDAVCLVSMSGNQLCFVYRPVDTETGGQLVASVRLRLDRGESFEGRMLVNYGERIGLLVQGLKRFEDYFGEEE